MPINIFTVQDFSIATARSTEGTAVLLAIYQATGCGYRSKAKVPACAYAYFIVSGPSMVWTNHSTHAYLL